MFRNLYVSIDTMAYDKDRGYSLIEGWAFNPVTKDPVTVEADIPIMFNHLSRPDISRIVGVTRKAPYGFFIQFPGDYRKLKPKFTFKSGVVEEEVNIHQLNSHQRNQKLKNLFWILTNYGLLKEKINLRLKRYDKLGPAYHQTEKFEPDDEFKDWIIKVEPSTFHEPVLQDKDITFIIRSDSDDISKTVESITANGPQEIIVVSEKELDIPEYKNIVNEDITKALNQAVEEANNDYVVFIDNTDVISPYFLNEFNYYLDKEGEADFIYSDSDLIDNNDSRYELDFKPDFNEMLLSYTNYILRPVIISKDLFKKVGGFRSDYYGLKDYDLILRATKEAEKVLHIPRILYHWRKQPDDPFDVRRKDLDLGLEILNDYLKDEPYEAIHSDLDFMYERVFQNEYPSVTIIMGVLDGFSDTGIEKSVKTILDSSDYSNLKIKLINAKPFKTESIVSFETIKEATNLAELYNEAAKDVDTDYLLFIRPSFRHVELSWLKEMVALAEYSDIGIVGPKIFNDLFQYDQGGLSIDSGKRVAYANGINIRSNGIYNSYRIPKEVFAVSTDCLLIENKLFKELDGFDTKLPVSQMDMDLSIRAREKGKKTVAALNTPVTFDEFDNMEGTELTELFDKYNKELLEDGSINPNIRKSGSAYSYVIEK